MGTDITAFIECRDEGGAWLPYRTYLDGYDSDCNPAPVRMVAEDYDICRNYRLFAALGYAREDGDDFSFTGIPPVAAPRGLPDDCSAPVRARYGSWCVSPSWLTFEEIKRIDWPAVVADSHPEIRRMAMEFALDMAATIPSALGVRDLERLRLVFWYDQ